MWKYNKQAENVVYEVSCDMYSSKSEANIVACRPIAK
jgi:hypothetical protein